MRVEDVEKITVNSSFVTTQVKGLMLNSSFRYAGRKECIIQRRISRDSSPREQLPSSLIRTKGFDTK